MTSASVFGAQSIEDVVAATQRDDVVVAELAPVVRFIARNGKRTAVAVAGVALLVAGVALLVLPGPGLLLVAAGLAVLGTEFVWAERALTSAKRRATGAGRFVAGRVRRREPGPGGGRSS